MVKNNIETPTTVIFGSVLGDPNPSDIDVAYTGEWNAEREALVRAWAAERGITDELPIDSHGTLAIPIPAGLEPSYETIEGHTRPYIYERHDLAALLRYVAATGDTSAFVRGLEAGEKTVSLLPPAEGDSDKYEYGLESFRTSAAKLGRVGIELGALLIRTNSPRLLGRLAVEDPVIWRSYPRYEDGLQWGRGWSQAATLEVKPEGHPVTFTGYAWIPMTFEHEDDAIETIWPTANMQ